MGQKCRTILDEINTLTYVIDHDEIVMSELCSHLEDIKNYLALAIQQRGQSRDHDTPRNDNENNCRNLIVSNKNTTLVTESIIDPTSSMTEHLTASQVVGGNPEDENVAVEIQITDHFLVPTSGTTDALENHNGHLDSEGVTQNAIHHNVVVGEDGEHIEQDLNDHEREALTKMISELLKRSDNTV